jgi:hypothetical protein
MIAFDLTGGEKGDAPHFPILLGLGPDIEPRAAVGDKGYASKANRQAARKRGIIPVIPHKPRRNKSRASSPRPFTEDAPASNKPSASSNASNASPYDARRRSEISHPLSHSQQASSWSNPSTPPRGNGTGNIGSAGAAAASSKGV